MLAVGGSSGVGCQHACGGVTWAEGTVFGKAKSATLRHGGASCKVQLCSNAQMHCLEWDARDDSVVKQGVTLSS